MGDDCTCARCQGDGYYDHRFEELRERLRTTPMTFCTTHALVESGLVERQRSCIEELVALIGYLPQAQAVLERYGLR